MKRTLFLIHSREALCARIAEREAARRAQLRALRSKRERHNFADPRIQLADDILTRRFEAT